MTHQERVAAVFPRGTNAHVVALFHDHLEDEIGPVPSHILSHVEVLTRGPNEAYVDYIGRVRDSGDPIAVSVKIADLHDNLLRCHGEFGGDLNPRRATRYRFALERLGAA